MKRILLLLTFVFGLLILQFHNIEAQTLNHKTLADDWIIVTSGDQMNDLIKNANAEQPLNIKADTDLTLGALTTIPENVVLTIDMNGHALYTLGDNRYFLSSGNKVTFQNEIIVSTGTRNDGVTVPKPSGDGTTSGRYNSYYGLFSTTGSSYKVTPTLTFKNVIQDFITITNWGSAGQPFYNYGIPVHFSGNNYFNYDNTGQEFMEGAGLYVLDGKTRVRGGNTNGYSFVQQTHGGNLGKAPAGIDVAAGAELEINWQGTGTVNGIWALNGGGGAKATEFHINNFGKLSWKSNKHAPVYFFGYSKTDVPFTYTFGPNSKTSITVPGLFNYNATSEAFNISIEKDANFFYDSGKNFPIFIGKNDNFDNKLNINSASEVRFSTTRSNIVGAPSIIGTGATIDLNSEDSTEGYGLHAYNNIGNEVLVPSLTKGAYGITGTLQGSLNNIGDLPGLHVPNPDEVAIYQASAELAFIKHNKQILSFKSIPDDSAMMFEYELDSKLVKSILPRNNGDSNMSFDIINTLSDSFAVQANTSNSSFPDGMNFAWKDGLSTIDLDDVNNTVFTSSSDNMTNDGHGNYQIKYQADEGLLFKSRNAEYQLGSYVSQINWTLINGIQ